MIPDPGARCVARIAQTLGGTLTNLAVHGLPGGRLSTQRIGDGAYTLRVHDADDRVVQVRFLEHVEDIDIPTEPRRGETE